MRTFSDTNTKPMATAFHAGSESFCVNFLKTSTLKTDPVNRNRKCENEVHCLSLNAFSLRFKHSRTWLMGSAPFYQSCSVGFIVTLFFLFIKR